jgi:hypothetical protein
VQLQQRYHGSPGFLCFFLSSGELCYRVVRFSSEVRFFVVSIYQPTNYLSTSLPPFSGDERLELPFFFPWRGRWLLSIRLLGDLFYLRCCCWIDASLLSCCYRSDQITDTITIYPFFHFSVPLLCFGLLWRFENSSQHLVPKRVQYNYIAPSLSSRSSMYVCWLLHHVCHGGEEYSTRAGKNPL